MAVRSDADEVPQLAITLAAVPVKPEADLDAFVQDAAQGKTLAVRNLQTQDTQKLTVADTPAIRQRVSYTARGVDSVADRVFVLAAVAGKPFKIGYLLSVEARPTGQDKLAAATDELLKSVRFSPPKDPQTVPLNLAADPVRAYDVGLSLRLPLGWIVESGRGGLRASQTDYLAGGLAYPMLTVTLQAPPTPSATAKDCACASPRPPSGSGPTRASRCSPKAPPPWAARRATRPSAASRTRTSPSSARRHVLFDGRDYAFSLSLASDQGDPAGAMLETIAKTVKLSPVSTAPATAQPPSRRPADRTFADGCEARFDHPGRLHRMAPGAEGAAGGPDLRRPALQHRLQVRHLRGPQGLRRLLRLDPAVDGRLPAGPQAGPAASGSPSATNTPPRSASSAASSA